MLTLSCCMCLLSETLPAVSGVFYSVFAFVSFLKVLCTIKESHHNSVFCWYISFRLWMRWGDSKLLAVRNDGHRFRTRYASCQSVGGQLCRFSCKLPPPPQKKKKNQGGESVGKVVSILLLFAVINYWSYSCILFFSVFFFSDIML